MTRVSVRICLLGPVAVLGDQGQQLAVDPGRVVGLDTLIEAIWDADPPAAPANGPDIAATSR
jgi:hypothetical protein